MKIYQSKQFGSALLDESDLAESPFVQFEKWYKAAEENGLYMPNAMSLATADASGYPSVRTVLLKYFDVSGFVFYTNYTSQKAQEIAANPFVEVLFYWQEMERQIRIRGAVEKISKVASLKYFATRSKKSQLGAWCSNQSSPISSRSLLLQKLKEAEQQFKSGKIPVPDFWGGYKIIPERFEFWQGGEHRLHDRFHYLKNEAAGKQWQIQRLSP